MPHKFQMDAIEYEMMVDVVMQLHNFWHSIFLHS